MKRILLVIVLGFLNSAVQAQDSSSTGKMKCCMMNQCGKYRHFGYIGLGYQYNQFNGLPSASFNGSGGLNGGGFALTGNRYIICHRMLFGGEFGGVSTMPTNNSTASAMVSQAFGFFNFGYLVIDKEEMMLYPYVGIGGIFNELRLKNKTNTDWVESEYTIKAGQKGNFSSAGAGINLGIGFKKTIMPCGSGYAMQIGLDVGARIAPYKSDWYYDGNYQSIGSFGTADNVSYYARLTIGGGSVKANSK